MDTKFINDLIGEAVQGYKVLSYKYLDEVKVLVFTYLLRGFSYDEFEDKLSELNSKYDKRMVRVKNKDYKEVKDKVLSENKEGISERDFNISEEDLEKLKFKLDNKSQFVAKEKYIRVIKNYYKNTYSTLQKEYIDEQEYLSKKLSKFDKVEKVVPYRHKNGTISAYFDIASYNSMVYNTNLTSLAWNSTFDSCQMLDEDIVYVEPHPFSCPLCQEYQGKFYSLTGKAKGYPLLEDTLYQNGGGLKHPNCKHGITTYVGQIETNDYSSPEWVARYEAIQKKQALELKYSRLENDQSIYQKLGNGEMVDKINQKLEKLTNAIAEQKELMKY